MPQIDGLRCVAILAVVLYHIEGYVGAQIGAAAPATVLQQVLKQGYYGVPLFFALSGFIIATPFLGPRPPQLRHYFLRRFTRLEPPYIINLLVVFALKVVFLGAGAAVLWPHLVASMLYLHNLVFGAHSLVNGVAWSLEIEWQFYVLAPLALAGVAKLRGVAREVGLWALIVGGGPAYLQGIDGDARFGLSLLCYIGFFAAGVWVALVYRDRRAVRRYWDGVGLLAWSGLLVALLAGHAGRVVLPALTALAVLSALRGPVSARVFGWWPVYCVGAMCYTIYLYHFFVVSAAGRFFSAVVAWPHARDAALVAFGVFAVPLVLVFCVVPYLAIERPFMVWRPGLTRLRDAVKSA